ncbi:MAG: tetratricopeptide repeat protein [Treponema sp.]|jgi:tetratricopeptide (TPR) repeat protein|nr:tetratricopeptide repeat protein [Treponema sp.]
MKKIRDVILAVLVVVVLGGAVLLVYQNERSKVHKNLAKRIAELSPRGGPPETIEGLRAAIAAYEAQIELNVKEGAQTGVYWKILAIRLADRGMHRDAIAAIERALYFNSTDPTLFYLSGDYANTVAAGIVGFSGNAGSEQIRFLTIAENSFLRAIELDSGYPKPRLGLGILYTFDLNRPAEAVPHLERYLELTPGDIKAMFVLARAFYMTDNFERAVELYDRIISQSKDPKVRAEAQNNKEIIQDIIYG